MWMAERFHLGAGLAVALITGSLAPASPAGAADQPPRYSVEELREDFTLVREALDELHPSLHWYTPAAELERAFDEAAEKLRQPMTEREFFAVVQPAVALVRCGHTRLETSAALEEWTDRQPAPYLPFRLWADAEKLYVLSNGSTDASIEPGDELTAINGVPAARLLAAAKQVISADGYNETWKYDQLNAFGGSQLKRFALHGLGIREPFALTLRRSDGRTLEKTVRRKPSPDGGASHASPPPDPPARTFSVLPEAVGLLTIRGFSYSDAKAFHQGVFKELQDKKIQNLIIDLRENTGGNGDDADDLMAYLVDRPFQSAVESWAKVRHPESPSFARYLDPRTRKLFLDNNKYASTRGGRYYFANAGVGTLQPHRQHHFGGAVYLLTSGRTFSSAALFAASLKAQRTITVIGQETGGGQAGCTAGINQKLTLPHTRARLFLPVFRIRSGNPAPNRGRGLMPDHEIRYGWRDRVADKDLEVAKALELIGHPPAKAP
jgi:C-terminal processing protease CtpA/Prc